MLKRINEAYVREKLEEGTLTTEHLLRHLEIARRAEEQIILPLSGASRAEIEAGDELRLDRETAEFNILVLELLLIENGVPIPPYISTTERLEREQKELDRDR